MAKGEWKVQIENDIINDSDSDDEYASPSYDELADLLKEYTQIIRKPKAKCYKLKDENEFLTAKYDIVVKASEEMKEENKTMSSTANELKTSQKYAKDKCEKLSEANSELKDRFVKVKEDYTKIKSDYDNLLIANELLSCNTHEAINPAVKIDVATSCDDLSQVDQFSLHDELTEKVEVLTLENQKLKRYLTDATTRAKVAIESNDINNELAVDNERLRDEVKKLKTENEHLATSVQKFNKGQYL
jgi:chromosome segregation ATPase